MAANGTILEQWPIARPKPYKGNPRKIPEAAVTKVARSIKEFGFRQPIVVDANDVIIAGHTRLKAAQQLELQTVPVVVAADLTEAQARAYRLADNRTAQESSWLDDLLAYDLRDLEALEFDLSATGFNANELAHFLGSVEPLDEYPELSDEDCGPIQQMTFTLHDEQVESVKKALAAAKALGDFGDTGNGNSNGNALARVCETFITREALHGPG